MKYLVLIILSILTLSKSGQAQGDTNVQTARLSSDALILSPLINTSDGRVLAKIRRWITDAENIDLVQISKEPNQQWNIIEFVPTYPGRTTVEQRAMVDPKTHSAVVDPNSSSAPLWKGQYIIRDFLGRVPTLTQGKYRLKAPPLFGFGLHSTTSPSTNPLLQGGLAVVRVNKTEALDDLKHFFPLYSIPNIWKDYISEAINAKEFTPKLLASPNPFLSLRVARQLLEADTLPTGHNMGTLVQTISEAHGLNKAILLAAVVSEQQTHPQNDHEIAITKEQVTQILKSASEEDLRLLLLALQTADVAFTNDPFTGKETSGIGPELLRAIDAIAQSRPEGASKQGLEILLKNFRIGTPQTKH